MRDDTRTTTQTTRIITAGALQPGDILVTRDGRNPRTVQATAKVRTTSRGTPRKRPPVQVHVISADERREMYSDVLYLTSWVYVQTTAPAAGEEGAPQA